MVNFFNNYVNVQIYINQHYNLKIIFRSLLNIKNYEHINHLTYNYNILDNVKIQLSKVFYYAFIMLILNHVKIIIIIFL